MPAVDERADPASSLLRSRGRGLGGVLVELALAVLALACNLVVRWYTLDDVDLATANARDLLALQETLGVDWERAVQDATLGVPWLGSFSSWFYVWGYLPVVVAGLVGLYVWRPVAYATLRNALLVSGAVGLPVYALYPVAPPRLTGPGYVDTVASSTVEAAARPVGVANEIAAVPSFHVAWLLVVAVVVFRVTRSVLVRIACVVHPAVMCFAVVVTGNHWVLDLPAGAAIAVVGLYGASRLARTRTSPAPAVGHGAR